MIGCRCPVWAPHRGRVLNVYAPPNQHRRRRRNQTPHWLPLARVGADERFTLLETPPQFYGVIAQSVTDSRRVRARAPRHREPDQSFDNFTSIIKVPFKVSRLRVRLLWLQPFTDTLEIVDATPRGGRCRGARHGFVAGGGKLSRRQQRSSPAFARPTARR